MPLSVNFHQYSKEKATARQGNCTRRVMKQCPNSLPYAACMYVARHARVGPPDFEVFDVCRRAAVAAVAELKRELRPNSPVALLAAKPVDFSIDCSIERQIHLRPTGLGCCYIRLMRDWRAAGLAPLGAGKSQNLVFNQPVWTMFSLRLPRGVQRPSNRGNS